MPYDTLQYGETTQNSGLAGVAAKGPPPIVYSGDYNVLRKGFGAPVLVGLGGVSASKATGCAVVGNRSYGVNKFTGPASLAFPMMHDLVVPFQEGEQLTGQLSNTNTNEASIVNADIAYGGAHAYPQTVGGAMAAAGGGELWSVPISCTAAAAVTLAYIGTLDGLTTDTGDQWLDTRAGYKIIGSVGCVGIVSDCGSITFTGLGGDWKGYTPAVRDHMIDPVTNDVRGGLELCYEGIPFDGDALPGYMANHLTNTAVLAGLLMVKQSKQG